MTEAKQGIHIAHRDSKTGRFVTEKYAKRHPSTTEKQHIKNLNQ